MKFFKLRSRPHQEPPHPGKPKTWLELGRKKAEVMRTVYALVALRILKPLPPKS